MSFDKLYEVLLMITNHEVQWYRVCGIINTRAIVIDHVTIVGEYVCGSIYPPVQLTPFSPIDYDIDNSLLVKVRTCIHFTCSCPDAVKSPLWRQTCESQNTRSSHESVHRRIKAAITGRLRLSDDVVSTR